jgi:hypothetical protein
VRGSSANGGGSSTVTVKKASDAQDTAILHGLRQASSASPKKWLFIEEMMPNYRLAADAIRVPYLHPSTVARRLEKLADRGHVLVSQKPKSVKWRGVTEERKVRAYRFPPWEE